MSSWTCQIVCVGLGAMSFALGASARACVAGCERMLRAVVSRIVFFSSRRRHTRYWRDWSSDVCSSDLLQGAIPGLTILSNNGNLNADPSISIRGLGTLSNQQKSSPLIIVDGVPTDDLTMINGYDIASISVLKDASSSAVYGARAAFGVILITTKQAKKGDRISVKYNGQMAWDQATVLPDFPSVPEQLRPALLAKERAGQSTPELFGMYFDEDRKSTRLNSSHANISYAVFCLKKKKIINY